MTKIEPVILSNSWVHCSTPFGLDSYTSCDFGCAYCFVNFRTRNWRPSEPEPATFERIKRVLTRNDLPPDKGQWQKFNWAFNNIVYKLGVRSDPFPYVEPVLKSTYKVMKLFEGKNLMVLTKNPCGVTQEYLDLGVKLAVGTSIASPDNRLEGNTPAYKDRLKSIEWLHSKGVLVHCRLTPTNGDWWSDEQLDELCSLPFYTITYSSQCSNYRDPTDKITGNDEEKTTAFYNRLLEKTTKHGIKIHISDAQNRLQGAKSCAPEGWKTWEGTYFDDIPKIPKECVMFPRGHNELCNELKEQGLSYIHLNRILHLFEKGRVEYAHKSLGWDKMGVNKFEPDPVNFPKVLF